MKKTLPCVLPAQISMASCNYRGGLLIVCCTVQRGSWQKAVIESPAAFEKFKKWGWCFSLGEDHLK